MHKVGSAETVRSGGSGGSGGPTAPTSLSAPSVLTKLRSALKQVVGMPDYARYLAHRQEAHPGCPLLSEREFYDQYIAMRYGGGVTRCC